MQKKPSPSELRAQKAEAAKARETARQEANKMRLWDTAEQIHSMIRMAQVRIDCEFGLFALDDNHDEVSRDGQMPKFGLKIEDGKGSARKLFPDSEDWEFDFIDELIRDVQNEVKQKLAEQEAKDAALRVLTAEQRAALGYSFWRDPKAK